jgi:osmotically-inducible protein OsmY
MKAHAQTSPVTASGRLADPPPADQACQEVERALRGSSHSGLRQVRCRYVDGCVVLSGSVASYYLKQIAQTIVSRFGHVKAIDNQLHVTRRD